MPQLAGEDILASDIKIPKYIQKAGTETVTSSVTLQNDDDFAVTLTPGVYRITLKIHATGVTSAVAGGLKAAWATTGTMTAIGRSCLGPAFGTADTADSLSRIRSSTHGLTTAVSYGVNASNSSAIEEDVLMEVTATGVLTFQWAQQVVSATGTALSAASRMYITEMEIN